MIEDRIKRDISHGHKMTAAQLVQAMQEPATEDIRAVLLTRILFKALGTPRNVALRKAIAKLSAWVAAGGHRRDLNRDGHDEFTSAITFMAAWWPKLLTAEFKPALGDAAFSAIEKMTGFGNTSFSGGWYGYASKDLRRLFANGSERGRCSRVYCGNIRGRAFSAETLQRRCRAALVSSLAAALKVSARRLYGGACPKDPEPACADQNRFTYFSTIRIPPFPYQNRPVFEQVVTLTRRLPR